MIKRAVLFSLLMVFCGCLADPSRTGEVAPCPNIPWIPPCPAPAIPCLPDTECEVSESPLELSMLLDIALKNNPLTSRAWHQARSAAFDVGAAKSFLYPTLTGTEEYLYLKTEGGIDSAATTPAFPNPSQTLIDNITLTYLLLDFGGRNATIQAAKQALLAADWIHNQVLQDVMINVLDSYFSHLAALALVVATQENLKDTKISLEAAESQFTAGIVNKVDVLQTRSQVASAQLQLASAQGDVKITKSQLAKAIGWLPNTCFDVAPMPEELMEESIPCGVETLMATAEHKRADLAASYRNYLQAKQQITIARSAGLPTLTLDVEAQKTHILNASSFNNSSYSALVTLNVPIFSGFLYQYQTASARANAAASFFQWKDKEANVFLEVLTSYYNYKTAIESIQFSKEFLTSTQEAYNASMLGYRNGLQNITDLLSAQSALERARTEWIRARLQFLISLAQVAYSTGTL